MGAVSLDEIDAEILTRLQRDGRASGEAIARTLDVSASTVRSRVEKLERAGVITGYCAGIDFGRAGFPIHVLLVCTAEGGLAGAQADELSRIPAVVVVAELVGDEGNVLVEVVAQDSDGLDRAVEAITEHDLSILDTRFITDVRADAFEGF